MCSTLSQKTVTCWEEMDRQNVVMTQRIDDHCRPRSYARQFSYKNTSSIPSCSDVLDLFFFFYENKRCFYYGELALLHHAITFSSN